MALAPVKCVEHTPYIPHQTHNKNNNHQHHHYRPPTRSDPTSSLASVPCEICGGWSPTLFESRVAGSPSTLHLAPICIPSEECNTQRRTPRIRTTRNNTNHCLSFAIRRADVDVVQIRPLVGFKLFPPCPTSPVFPHTGWSWDLRARCCRSRTS